jgi:hypothetical protein
MSILKFKCELISDVVLNVKSATEGNKQTLDFIPGNNFLGIVAKKYKDLKPEESWYIFHSGKVKFGDAHPVGVIGKRSLKVPASFFYPKNPDKEDPYYIHHFYDREKDHKDHGFPYQLKQSRNGFYTFTDRKGIPSNIEKSFSIKSAYDRDKRRSKDKTMFGYESLNEGMIFYFAVETEDDIYDDFIKKELIGEKNIGRSRTAQYGRVRIELCEYEEHESRKKDFEIKGEKCIAVYADSRLIFIDENIMATYQPTPEDLGIKKDKEACIKWEYSQIRTFQYAPWNSQRQAYDTDRCGIEKGSVIIVKTNEIPNESKYIGKYNNEGFGKVIYNPEFLDSDGENGLANFKLIKPTKEKTKVTAKKEIVDENLINFLRLQQKESKVQEHIYEIVNKFVETNYECFADSHDTFASQWGQIRSITMKYKTISEIEKKLFTKDDKGKSSAYLTHGIAEKKWKECQRKDKFYTFFETLKKNDLHLSDDNVRNAIINLASQMAKKCRKENVK